MYSIEADDQLLKDPGKMAPRVDINEEECLKSLRQALERGDTEAINRIHDSHIHKAKFKNIEISKLRQDTFAISS